MLVVGVDCGKNGGIAYYCTDSAQYGCFKMPETRKQVFTCINDLKTNYGRIKAIVERVHSMPKQGVASTFTFGKGVGEVLGVLTALGAEILEPTPQEWKKHVLKGTAKDKTAAIQVAENLYPEINLVPPGCRKPSDGCADAVCLMHYGRMFI